MTKKLVYGFGINDVEYVVKKHEELPKVNGKRKNRIVWECPYYRKWKSMLRRCYSKSSLKERPTYQGCTVCEEWRYLSNFIKWVDTQPERNWENCELDKDFLIQGNKIYSVETAVFIAGKLNSFTVDCGRGRGGCMIGVSYQPNINKSNPYIARCMDPFGNNSGYVGYYPTELQAHKAWQERKHYYACLLADQQSDPRVAEALRQRYAPDKDWTNR